MISTEYHLIQDKDYNQSTNVNTKYTTTQQLQSSQIINSIQWCSMVH